MTDFKLSQDTPKRLVLHSAWYFNHGPNARSVWVAIYLHDDYITQVSFTPAEARAFGQMLIDEAEHIEKVGKPTPNI